MSLISVFSVCTFLSSRGSRVGVWFRLFGHRTPGGRAGWTWPIDILPLAGRFVCHQNFLGMNIVVDDVLYLAAVTACIVCTAIGAPHQVFEGVRAAALNRRWLGFLLCAKRRMRACADAKLAIFVELFDIQVAPPVVQHCLQLLFVRLSGLGRGSVWGHYVASRMPIESARDIRRISFRLLVVPSIELLL